MPHLVSKEIKVTIKHKRKKRRILKTISNGAWFVSKTLAHGISLGIGVIATLVLLFFLAYLFVHSLVAPDVKKFLANPPPESAKIYSQDGKLMYEVFKDIKRTSVPLGEISPYLQKATIAGEDREFYQHRGVSVSGIIRSAIVNYISGDASNGGSTITQQLVKNAILTPEKSVVRKIAEVIWAVDIERGLTKDQILEKYLNYIPYGRNTAGVEAASLSYFGKPAKELNLVESAYLSALPQAPSLLSPNGPNRDFLESRKNYILQNMREQGYISTDEYNSAKQEQVTFKKTTNDIINPYFVLWIKEQLIQKFGEQAVYEEGYKVFTTLDSRLQAIAEKVVSERVEKNSVKFNSHNAGLVAIDPKTGYILAFVGGKGYDMPQEPIGCAPGKSCTFDPKTNVAIALRQPGSSFKPYVYVTAFGEDFKWTPSTIVEDISKNFSVQGSPAYIPRDYNGGQYGKISVRKALAGSLNIAAVNTLSQIGIDPVINTVRNLGFTAPFKNCGLALALGACEVSLLEHVSGFAVFANMGKKNETIGYSKIVDKNGKTIFQAVPENKEVINPQAVYELVDIMTDNKARTFIFGANTPLILKDRKVAVKTGTTQNWKDSWTVGFTPSLAAGVWTGNNNGALQRAGSDGVFVAAPIWNAFMTESLKNTPPEEFPEPYGIIHASVNSRGEIIKSTSKSAAKEIFANYSIPISEIKVPSPKKISIIKPTIAGTTDSNESTIILEPLNNSTIIKNPFYVKVFTGTSTIATKVDLLLDGKHIQSKDTPPFLFTISNKNITNGWHTLTAKATHFEILESTSSIRIKTFFNPPPINPRGTVTGSESKP